MHGGLSRGNNNDVLYFCHVTKDTARVLFALGVNKK